MIIRNDNVSLIDPNLSFINKMRYITKFVGRAFFIALFVVMFLFFILGSIYLFDYNLNVKKGVYKYPIFGSYVIVSPSMVPTINVLDGIVVRRDNNIKMGDIITFDSSDIALTGKTITHRIVGSEVLSNGNILYRTKGDNNMSQDRTLVNPSDVHGRVVATIPKIGYLQNYLTNPIYLFLTILFIVIGVIYTTKRQIDKGMA